MRSSRSFVRSRSRSILPRVVGIVRSFPLTQGSTMGGTWQDDDSLLYRPSHISWTNLTFVQPLTPLRVLMTMTSHPTRQSRYSSTTSSSSSPPSSDGSINRFTRSSQHKSSISQQPSVSLDEDPAFDRHVVDFLTIKTQPFAVSGRIPCDTRNFTLFFRTPSGTSHSVDFPIDPEDDTSAAFEMLLETCKVFTSFASSTNKGSLPHHSAPSSAHYVSAVSPPHRVTRGPYIFPPQLPLSTTFDIGNHPVLETVKDVLFPNLPSGYYLTADRAILEMTPPGSKSRTLLAEEDPHDKVATLILTLPVRYRGGALVITHPEDKLGIAERCRGRAGKSGALEWTAFLSDCTFGVEPVETGCRVTLSYNIRLKPFGPSGSDSLSLISPTDRFLDSMTPLFARAKNIKLGFFLSGSYNILPSETTADALAPQLKGGDSVLFHASKLYGFNVEFRYAAGGYIWDEKQTIQLATTEDPTSPSSLSSSSSSSSSIHDGTTSARRRKLSVSMARNAAIQALRSNSEEEEQGRESHSVRQQVLASGAVKLAHAGVHALTALSRSSQGPVTRLPVSFIADGGLNRLWVNVLMVVWRS